MKVFSLHQRNLRISPSEESAAGKPVEQGFFTELKEFWSDESGVTVIEIILILVVLIALVVLFKTQLTSLVNTILSKITSQSNKI